MVENAIQHGISKRTAAGLVRIAASRTDGVLALTVYNDGTTRRDRLGDGQIWHWYHQRAEPAAKPLWQ